AGGQGRPPQRHPRRRAADHARRHGFPELDAGSRRRAHALRAAMDAGHKRPHPLVALVPYLWLAAFFLVPFAIVFRLSLSDDVLAQPPYAPPLDLSAGWNGLREFVAGLDFENYAFGLTDSLYVEAYWQSVWIAGLSTVILMVVGFP